MLRYELDWERTEDGMRILRAYGRTAEVVLPEEIEGVLVTEIGACCFAERAHLPEHYERTRVEIADIPEGEAGGPAEIVCEGQPGGRGDFSSGIPVSGQLHELSGRFIEKLVLPDSVKKIGNLAFYNCTALSQLEFGSALKEIGSDAFMNCKKLHQMCVRAGSGEQSGIRQILAQISSDMEVTFLGQERMEAVLLFPEYYESYDEIAPAHLFGRNIEGEGFRARQCFKDGRMDYVQYDTIFPKACAEESEKTLCRLALNRLRYPVDLRGDAKSRYEKYLHVHAAAICAAAAKERDMQTVLFLCEQGLCGREDLERVARVSAELAWAEGAAWSLRLLEQFFPQKPAESRYEFEDF